jgi:hypothetical protein
MRQVSRLLWVSGACTRTSSYLGLAGVALSNFVVTGFMTSTKRLYDGEQQLSKRVCALFLSNVSTFVSRKIDNCPI